MTRGPAADRKPSAPATEATPSGASPSHYSPKEYWEALATSSGPNEAQARAAVLHPDAPDWFNRAIDRLQAKAWLEGLRRCELRPGARVLDVGCGTGRWLERLEQAGMAPTGIDRTEAMLRIARRRLPRPGLVAAEAQRLPFADASFDCVCAVTVLQHIVWEEQAEALREMARVARPGGSVVLLDLIRGQGAHIFPRTPEDWVELGACAGVQIGARFGQEFLLFDRPLRRAAVAVRRLGAEDGTAPLPGRAAGEKRALGRRAYWLARRLAVTLSLWTEPLAEGLCPLRFATHGVFVFRKPAREA